jgi:tetratricopeptide (TPR) repeat protein
MVKRAWVVRLLAIVIALSAGRSAGAQEATESPELGRAYELETAGRFREAAEQFRTALRGKPNGSALLGLERMYSALRKSDSLLPILDTLIARDPREPLYRSVQMRTLQILRDEGGLRSAFERWISAVPRDPAPYREYARVLIALGRPVLADSVVQRSRAALGSGRALAFETAQVRAAQGLWEESAQAWREALVDAPYLSDAASYALAPTPIAMRPRVRSALDASRELGPRRALAELELGWGRPQEAWDALRSATPDTAAATAWAEFGERAMAEDRPAIAHEALVAALRVRRTPELALRAATAALQSGAPADVLLLLPIADVDADASRLARDYLPLQVAALSAMGRPADAEALVRKFDAVLAPGQHERMARALANAWVRTGDLVRARAALGSGPDADSSEAAGWLALYEGRLADARVLLKNAHDPSAGLAFALGVVARTHGDDGAALGAALLALARADTASAIARFVEAADRHPEAGPALLLAGARLRLARRDQSGAIDLWRRIVTASAEAPEATEAELEWARALRRTGDTPGAVTHLEHLILSAPQSALLPQARRELDLARAAVPSP